MHHCNIDRLWASWNRCGRKNPVTPSWLNQTFTFADENGQAVTGKVSGFDSLQELGYTYDHFETVPGCGAPILSAAAAAPPAATTLASSIQGMAAAAGGIALGTTAVRVKLAAPPSPAAAAPTPLGIRVQELPDTQQIYLVIRNYRAAVQPRVLYNVYLDLPPGASSGEGHYAGSINFFDAVPLPDHASHGAAAPDGVDRFVSFDVTELAKRLRAEGRLTDSPSVTIMPAGKPESQANSIVGEISLVAQ
jgi:tyrosinase